MKKRAVTPIRQGVALIGAAGITAVSIWLLALLNARALPKLPTRAELRTVTIRGPEIESDNQDEPEPEPQPQPPNEEVMTVDLDLPTPDVPQPEPLDLDMSLPSPVLAQIQVAIRRDPVPPRPAAPRKQQTPAQSAPRQAHQVEQPPRERAGNPAPGYPARERQLGIEGRVQLQLLIDESGKVEDVKFLNGSEAFRKAVQSVVWRWRFTPAHHQGRAVKVWGIKDVEFRLRGS